MTQDRLFEQAIELLAIADFHSLTLKEERNQVVREAIELSRQPKPDQNELQEPVAWATKEDFHRELERRLKHIREEMKIKSVTMRCKNYDIALPIIDTDFGRVLVGQVSTPPQRKPLTDEQRKDLMNKAWNKWLGGEDDNHLFAWHFSFEVEAAHGIKGDA